MKRLTTAERLGVLGIILVAWALRWVALMDVPPGWRDDDLVEVYTLSNEILTGGFKLYYAEAWGQAPLYHTIRAPLLAIAGINQASVRWLSATFGTLAVLLTWAAGRRFFNRATGLLAGAITAVSFWSLMYSRIAIRHIGALPWMLLAIYWGWRLLRDTRHSMLPWSCMVLGTAGAMLTYYAGRLVPVVLIGELLFIPSSPNRRKRFLTALLVGLALTIPTFYTAYLTPGADARVSELAYPLKALLAGNIQPLLQNIWMTLGMFHTHGDPEWLYNIPFRPVYSLVVFGTFIASLINQALHLHQSRARVTLFWLLVGISPAFISQPESSLGHTILALPATFILLAAIITIIPEHYALGILSGSLVIWGLVLCRDIPDYFMKWPNYSMVNFLYRGDYRQVSRYLDENREISQAAIGTMLFGPWDKIAVKTDIHRQDTTLRWVNPDRALINNSAGSLVHYLQEESAPDPLIVEILTSSPKVEAPAGLLGYVVTLPEPGSTANRSDENGTALTDMILNESMQLEAIQIYEVVEHKIKIAVWWSITGHLPLPPEKLYPPPYGVYGGPRLSVFVHLLQDDEYIDGDDGLWVDPYSLQVGDRLLQVHQLQLAEDGTADYRLAIGLYDPWTGERWQTGGGEDHIVVFLTLDSYAEGQD
jgi:hypothetical protein